MTAARPFSRGLLLFLCSIATLPLVLGDVGPDTCGQDRDLLSKW